MHHSPNSTATRSTYAGQIPALVVPRPVTRHLAEAIRQERARRVLLYAARVAAGLPVWPGDEGEPPRPAPGICLACGERPAAVRKRGLCRRCNLRRIRAEEAADPDRLACRRLAERMRAGRRRAARLAGDRTQERKAATIARPSTSHTQS